MEAYKINGQSIPQILRKLAKKGNPAFTASLHPGVEQVLGCRLPDLRKLAKTIARTDWEAYLQTAGTHYMEERTLYGLVLGYISPGDFQAYLKRVDIFVERINSWSVCDSFTFAGGKAYLGEHRVELWEYLRQKMTSQESYTVRFGVVMSLRYFIDREHLSSLYILYISIHHADYYVKMAVAWAVAECFIQYPQETMAYLKQNDLERFTFNKALQKITESFRVDKDTKDIIRKMKRKQ